MKTFKLSLIITLIILIFCFSQTSPITAGSLTSVKDTLSSSQLSYFARSGQGNLAGNSPVYILLGSSNPSNTTNNLFIGDTVAIGTTGSDTSLRTYTVTDIGNTAYFTVGIGLSTINSYTNVAIISTRSAIHTITFTPQQNYQNGIFEFLIKASSRSGENYKDGIPDQQGFDFGQSYSGVTTGAGTSLTAADVACPLSATASVGTTTTIGNNSYHVIRCTLTGNADNAIGQSYYVTIGRDFSVGSQLSNPSPGLNHIEGSTSNSGTDTDVYSFYVRHYDSGNNLLESTQGKVALIEAVRVTATVDPTLTFTIDNTGVTGAGTTICNSPLSPSASNTTSTSVSFGSLSLNNIANLAQHLSITTNANGYILTTYADKPMTITSGLGTTIPNTSCDAGTCTYTSQAGWTGSGTGGTTAKYGFGYSLDAGTTSSGTSIAFSSTNPQTISSRPFGQGSAEATTIMSNNSVPILTDNAYVCYRINVGPVQAPGNYEAKVIYTATATF